MEKFVLVGLMFVAIVLTSAIAAVPFMLAAGVLHGYFSEVPAFSFLQSLVIVLAVKSLYPTKVETKS